MLVYYILISSYIEFLVFDLNFLSLVEWKMHKHFLHLKIKWFRTLKFRNILKLVKRKMGISSQLVTKIKCMMLLPFVIWNWWIVQATHVVLLFWKLCMDMWCAMNYFWIHELMMEFYGYYDMGCVMVAISL